MKLFRDALEIQLTTQFSYTLFGLLEELADVDNQKPIEAANEYKNHAKQESQDRIRAKLGENVVVKTVILLKAYKERKRRGRTDSLY